MITLPDNWRELVVTEAHTWLKTPYHHEGDVKGAGVDCAMILVRVYCDLGLAPMFDPRPYPKDWFLHQDEERYVGWLEQYAHRIDAIDVGPGDIILHRIGRTGSHGAICIDDNLMIHSYAPSGCVELRERRAIKHQVDSYWSLGVLA